MIVRVSIPEPPVRGLPFGYFEFHCMCCWAPTNIFPRRGLGTLLIGMAFSVCPHHDIASPRFERETKDAVKQRIFERQARMN